MQTKADALKEETQSDPPSQQLERTILEVAQEKFRRFQARHLTGKEEITAQDEVLWRGQFCL